MYLKKYILIITLLSFPLIAQADLTTYNFTNEDSSVAVTSGTIHPCSSTAGIYTPAQGESHATNFQITTLCKTSVGECEADIYMTKNCSGPVAAHSTLNLNTKLITTVVSSNPIYTFAIKNNGAELDITYSDKK